MTAPLAILAVAFAILVIAPPQKGFREPCQTDKTTGLPICAKPMQETKP